MGNGYCVISTLLSGATNGSYKTSLSLYSKSFLTGKVFISDISDNWLFIWDSSVLGVVLILFNIFLYSFIWDSSVLLILFNIFLYSFISFAAFFFCNFNIINCHTYKNNK